MASENDTTAETDPLATLSEGDQISIPSRETPMTVTEVSETPTGTTSVTAENHHGTYRLRSHRDGSVSVRVGDEKRLLSGDVEVVQDDQT